MTNPDIRKEKSHKELPILREKYGVDFMGLRDEGFA
jgi:hypothetical protein